MALYLRKKLDNKAEIAVWQVTETEEELLNQGINMSKIHVDFMIGTKDLNITGITQEGKEITIFENGNFSEIFK